MCERVDPKLHSLEISDVVPGDLGGGAHRDGGEHDLDITLDELLHRQVIILHPMPCFRQPNLLMGHCAVRGGLSEAFCVNPSVVDGSASPTPRRMRFAC